MCAPEATCMNPYRVGSWKNKGASVKLEIQHPSRPRKEAQIPMRLAYLLRSHLRLQAHRVVRVRRRRGGKLEARVERIGKRKLKCGQCGRRVGGTRGQSAERRWQDLKVLGIPLVIVYAPWRVDCPVCGVKRERVPWARKRARVTRPLGRAVAVWARRLSWTDTAALFGVNWKTVVKIVRQAVDFGLKRRRIAPVSVLGVDEVSRAKGHKYFTLFYDLKRGLLLWVGEDRTEATAKAFFDWFGEGVKHVTAACLDMWAPYVAAFKARAEKAVLVFDRFHLVRHLNEAVDEVRRAMVRELKGDERAEMKGTRYLWLKNPWNLKVAERPRLAALLRQHLPIVKAYLLKESFRDFWSHQVREEAGKFLKHWFWMATHSRLKPLREFAWRLRRHEEGILAWIDLRISNGAVEGMNTKIQSVARRAFGFRTSSHFKLAIYHCCADLPLPS